MVLTHGTASMKYSFNQNSRVFTQSKNQVQNTHPMQKACLKYSFNLNSVFKVLIKWLAKFIQFSSDFAVWKENIPFLHITLNIIVTV
ncbi:hypothetical protein FKM82_013302 [Ascaphus truei]